MTTIEHRRDRDGVATHRRVVPDRVPRHRVIQGAVWGLVLVGLTLLALRFSGPLWIGHNGDHAYYTAMTLQYGEVDYARSLRKVAQYFDYAEWSYSLDYGFLNPVVAPLIYPRPVYPLLAALPVHVLGMKAMYLPGLAAGAVATVAIGMLVLRQTRAAAGLLVLPLLFSTHLFTEFVFGIYTDAFVVALVALIMLALPWNGPKTWAHVTIVCALAAVMLLARQVPLVPLGIVGGGWLWACIRDRRLRNDWFPYLVAGVPATIVSYLLISKWAPYDPSAFMKMKTETDSTLQAMSQVWELLDRGLTIDAGFVWHVDKFVLPLFVLTLVGLWLCRRSPLAGVFVGLFLAGFITTSLNGANTEFRYMTPALPAAAMLVAEVIVRVVRLARARSRQPVEPETADWPVPRFRMARVSAALSVISLVAFVIATVAIHQPASLENARSMEVSRATMEEWPLGVSEGTLLCAGDNRQMWFRAPDGTLYAASGSAMARSFFRPRITELASGEVPYAWPEFQPLLDAGERLCTGSGGRTAHSS
jgi:hypothetical protein